MRLWRTVRSRMRTGVPGKEPDSVSLGTRRAVITFLLIMGMAVLLVAAISKVLH